MFSILNMHLLRKRLLRRSTKGKLSNGSWTSLKMKQTIIAEPFTHKTWLSFLLKRRLFKYNVIIDVMNKIIFYTGGVLVRRGNRREIIQSCITAQEQIQQKGRQRWASLHGRGYVHVHSERIWKTVWTPLVNISQKESCFTTAYVTQINLRVTTHAFLF